MTYEKAHGEEWRRETLHAADMMRVIGRYDLADEMGRDVIKDARIEAAQTNSKESK